MTKVGERVEAEPPAGAGHRVQDGGGPPAGVAAGEQVILAADGHGRRARSLALSSIALQHWFGVGMYQVWSWRRAFGVRQWEPEGSARLHQIISAKGAAGIKRRRWTPAERNGYRERSIRLNLIRFAQQSPVQGGHPVWVKRELVLLGTLSDAEVAARIGRTEAAVRVKRIKLGIPTARTVLAARRATDIARWQ